MFSFSCWPLTFLPFNFFSTRLLSLHSLTSQDKKEEPSGSACIASKRFRVLTGWKDIWESTPAKSHLRAPSVHLPAQQKTNWNLTAELNTKCPMSNTSKKFILSTPTPRPRHRPRYFTRTKNIIVKSNFYHFQHCKLITVNIYKILVSYCRYI